ncbi:MAG TPA: DUF6299 family protein [Gemmatimonadales bacterium]|nr:DUF6299 family protein [Gemmatimonadales bacterium]
MRRFALPATALALAVAACSEGPNNPAQLAPPVFDVTPASVPSNDAFSGATVVSVPFSEVLNTTEATTDADDAQLNASCGAPATDASVWYVLTPVADVQVVIDVSQSDYSAGVLVGVGSQGNLSTVTCGPGAVSFFATALTTYYVLAIDDQFDSTGNGGSLSISFSEIQGTTLDALTVDRFGKVDAQTGIATISGTYACSHGDFLSTSVDARQNVGRFTIFGSGSFFDSGTCDGASHAWAADVFPQNGKFAGGKSMTVTFAFTCGASNCAFGFVERTVVLRGGKT